MKKLKELRNKRFFGKPAHIGMIMTGVAMIVYSTYWLGRSEEIDEIIDIVEEYGETTLNFCNKKTKGKTKIQMSLIGQ